MTTKQQRVISFMLTNSRGTRWFLMAVPFLLTWGGYGYRVPLDAWRGRGVG